MCDNTVCCQVPQINSTEGDKNERDIRYTEDKPDKNS